MPPFAASMSVSDSSLSQIVREETERPFQPLSSSIETLRWEKGRVVMLDQTKLPLSVQEYTVETVQEMIIAIQSMVVRGAPAIGIAGGYGVVISALSHQKKDLEAFQVAVCGDAAIIRESRPTAVNLMWAVDQQLAIVENGTSVEGISDALLKNALEIHTQDILMCQHIGHHGMHVIPQGGRVLTHCNAGAIATGGYGTALGVVRSAFAVDPTVRVWADETRPRMQGLKLTAWELAEDNIPVTVMTDGMAAHLMKQGQVDVVIVGADRIAANGDTANKIGTYGLALVAKAHNIPFYVAAPTSTIDGELASGEGIPIENRNSSELWGVLDSQAATSPLGSKVEFWTPAFDVTPAELITGIITEHGLIQGEYAKGIDHVLQKARKQG